MDIAQLKQQIIRKINETEDIELLRKIAAIINSYNNTPHMVNESTAHYGSSIVSEEIVAYTVDGNPLTKAAYISILDEAQNEIENGDFFTTNEVRKLISSWRK